LDKALPPLGPRSATTTGFAVNKEHSPATLQVKTFNCIKNIPYDTEPFISRIWNDLGKLEQHSWATEADIRTLTKCVLKDVIECLGLSRNS
jgi:hypothetical protein